jgi:hypothetical protein
MTYSGELGIRPGVYHLGGGYCVRVDAYAGGVRHGRRVISRPSGDRGTCLVALAGPERDRVVKLLTECADILR